jgi:O-antigen biosynthesis protein
VQIISCGTAGDGARHRLRSSFCWPTKRLLSGFVADDSDTTRKFVVELLIDGLPAGTARADEYVHELAEQDFGDGCYGFSFPLNDDLLRSGRVAEARIANLGTLVGAPIEFSQTSGGVVCNSGPGHVRWLGGLRFTGWLAESIALQPMEVLVDGETIARVQASGWCHVGADPETAKAVRAFDFHLPEAYSDGRPRQLTVLKPDGQHLPGSPTTFVAFAGGLATMLKTLGASVSDRLRGEQFDRLVPMSVPFSQYHAWRESFPPPPTSPSPMQAAIILVGVGDTKPTLESLHRQTHVNWIAARIPETSGPINFCPQLIEEFLASDGCDSDIVLFVLSGTVLTETALERIAATFATFDTARAVYGDLDIVGPDKTIWPMALSAFDYERLLEQGYCGLFFAMSRPAAEQALASGASDLYRLFNSILDDGMIAAKDVVHIPGALAVLTEIDAGLAQRTLATATRTHLDKRGVSAEVRFASNGLMPAVRVMRHVDGSMTTIIIPTRNHRQLLQKCIDSVQPAIQNRAVEVIVVDNDSSDVETLDYLRAIDGTKATVMRVSGPFNFSRLNNIAARAAKGDNLCLLNNDVQALDSDWLSEMLGRLVDPEVGAVGALLVWPTGVVQHGGVVLGSGFAAAHAFNDRLVDDVGYCDLLRIAHECSAVTAACLLTRRADFFAVGGLDELRFPINFNDVDYCLKLRAVGKRIVLTPHAKLLHLESASRGIDRTIDRWARCERELQNLRSKWGRALISDSYYNPTLSLDQIPFSALAWPPRNMAPRVIELPIPVSTPFGI